jgi:hypothetical protein
MNSKTLWLTHQRTWHYIWFGPVQKAFILSTWTALVPLRLNLSYNERGSWEGEPVQWLQHSDNALLHLFHESHTNLQNHFNQLSGPRLWVER